MDELSNRSDRRAEFLELYTRFHPRLHGYILALLGSRQDADDVLQRSSLVLWQKFEQFGPGSDFLAWATTIAFYESRSFLRWAGHRRPQFGEALLSTLAEERRHDLSRQERRLGALERCLEKLGEPDRDLVRKAYAGVRPIKDLAAELGRAPQTLYNKLNQLRRLLVECVERRLAESEDDA